VTIAHPLDFDELPTPARTVRKRLAMVPR
jgi:hypothetical protein